MPPAGPGWVFCIPPGGTGRTDRLRQRLRRSVGPRAHVFQRFCPVRWRFERRRRSRRVFLHPVLWGGRLVHMRSLNLRLQRRVWSVAWRRRHFTRRHRMRRWRHRVRRWWHWMRRWWHRMRRRRHRMRGAGRGGGAGAGFGGAGVAGCAGAAFSSRPRRLERLGRAPHFATAPPRRSDRTRSRRTGSCWQEERISQLAFVNSPASARVSNR